MPATHYKANAKLMSSDKHITGKQADHAVKKYKSDNIVPLASTQAHAMQTQPIEAHGSRPLPSYATYPFSLLPEIEQGARHQ